MSYLETHKQPAKGNSGRNLELQTWRDYYLVIRERFFLGAAIACLVSGLVGYLLMSRPPVYASQAALLLDREGEARVLDMQKVVETGLDSSGQMWRISLENHINQLKSRSFRRFVVDSLSDEEKQRILAPYQDEEFPPSASSILSEIQILSVPNSFILQVQARHRDPEVAAMIANTYVERYIDFNRERSQAGNEAALAFLHAQEQELKEKLKRAEERLQAYQRQHNLISIGQDQSPVSQRLGAISTSLTNAQIARIQLETQIRQVEEYQKEGKNLMEILTLSSLGSTPQAVGELDRLRKLREVMSEKYGHRHPAMIANQREIEAAEGLIQANIDLAIAGLHNQLARAKEHEEDLIAEMRQAEQDSLQLDEAKVQYAALERSVTAIRNTYGQILDRIDETSITSQMEISSIRIFDRGSVSSNPVEPNVKRIGMLVVFLGGFFFFGAPIGLAALDNKLKNARDVEDFLGEKLLGELSSVSNVKKAARPHVVEECLDDRAVEGFRALFSQLELSSKNSYPKAILTTSTIPGEGKSFVTTNLGYSFAAHGKRTLLIDFDLRRPSLHIAYGRMNNDGILPWLESEASLAENPDLEGLKIGEVAPNLFLLSSGGQTKRATEAVSLPAVSRMIAALKKQYDVLVIDTPPLGVFSDALPLSQLVDETLYVVHFGRVERQQVKNSLKRLKEANPHMLGVVMNSMPRGSRFAHYYQGYGFGSHDYAQYYARKR